MQQTGLNNSRDGKDISRSKALALAVKHLDDIEQFSGPGRPCGDPDAECPISMGEWFKRGDKEELASIRETLHICVGGASNV